MTRFPAKVLSSENEATSTVTVKIELSNFRDHLIASTGNSATQIDQALVLIYGMFVIETENMGRWTLQT
jgi:hypothetical protein